MCDVCNPKEKKIIASWPKHMRNFILNISSVGISPRTQPGEKRVSRQRDPHTNWWEKRRTAFVEHAFFRNARISRTTLIVNAHIFLRWTKSTHSIITDRVRPFRSFDRSFFRSFVYFLSLFSFSFFSRCFDIWKRRTMQKCKMWLGVCVCGMPYACMWVWLTEARSHRRTEISLHMNKNRKYCFNVSIDCKLMPPLTSAK